MAKILLGQMIHRLRKERGITQAELCDGYCDRSALALLENGKHTYINAEFIMHITQKLGVPFDAILETTFIDYDHLYFIEATEIIRFRSRERANEFLNQLKKANNDLSQKMTTLINGYLALWDNRFIKAEYILKPIQADSSERLFRPIDLLFVNAYLEVVLAMHALENKLLELLPLVTCLDKEVRHCEEFYPDFVIDVHHNLSIYYRVTKRKYEYVRCLRKLEEFIK